MEIARQAAKIHQDGERPHCPPDPSRLDRDRHHHHSVAGCRVAVRLSRGGPAGAKLGLPIIRKERRA